MEKETMIYNVYDFNDLKNNSWSGAVQVLDFLEEKGLENEAMEIISDFIGGGVEETKLNDFIWFDLEDIIEYDLECED